MVESLFTDSFSIIPDLIKGTITLFTIMDPIGNIPILLSLTKEMKREEKSRVTRTTTLVGFTLLLFFALAGNEVFRFFEISLENFMIAGGVLLLVIAIKILIFGEWTETRITPENIGAVPLAMPLLVGPGAITATILTLQSSGIIITLLSVTINFGIVWIIFRSIDPIYKILGKTGSDLIARIFAMFIAAIAVGFIIEGVKHHVV